MSQSERWQLGGNAAEVYETELVPAILSRGRLSSWPKQRCGPASEAPRGMGRVWLHVWPRNKWALAVTWSVLTSTWNLAVRVPRRCPEAPQRNGGKATLEHCPLLPRASTLSSASLDFSTFPIVSKLRAKPIASSNREAPVLVWRALAHSPGFAALATALERHVSTHSRCDRAPFVFGDTADELRGLLVRAGFRTVRLGVDVRMVRFASPEAWSAIK